MKTTMIPGCCGLKTIYQIACLGKEDAFSVKQAEDFGKLVDVGTAGDGNWSGYGKAKDTIAIITDSSRYNKPEEFARQYKFFEEKGWKLLARWNSYESGGHNYMWGNPGMQDSEEAKAKGKK